MARTFSRRIQSVTGPVLGLKWSPIMLLFTHQAPVVSKGQSCHFPEILLTSRLSISSSCSTQPGKPEPFSWKGRKVKASWYSMTAILLAPITTVTNSESARFWWKWRRSPRKSWSGPCSSRNRQVLNGAPWWPRWSSRGWLTVMMPTRASKHLLKWRLSRSLPGPAEPSTWMSPWLMFPTSTATFRKRSKRRSTWMPRAFWWTPWGSMTNGWGTAPWRTCFSARTRKAPLRRSHQQQLPLICSGWTCLTAWKRKFRTCLWGCATMIRPMSTGFSSNNIHQECLLKTWWNSLNILLPSPDTAPLPPPAARFCPVPHRQSSSTARHP